MKKEMNATNVATSESANNVNNSESANELRVSDYLAALNKKGRELLKEEDERQARCLADAESLPTPEAKKAAVNGCRLHLLGKSKARIVAAFKEAQTSYLLKENTEYKEAQANIIRLAVADFAANKEDGAAFVQWVNDNGKAYHNRVIDTPDRMKALLRDLYKDYTTGRKALAKTKAEKAEETKATNDIFAMLAYMTPEQRAALKARL